MGKKYLLIFFVSFLIIPNFVLAQSPTQKSQLQKEEKPSLVIISPREAEQIFGEVVKVSFLTTHFIFTNSTLRINNAIGEGHLLAWIDDENHVRSTAKKINKATDFTIENVPPGPHILTLELVNNDESPLDPPVSQAVHFVTLKKQVIPTLALTEIKEEKSKNKQIFGIEITMTRLVTGLITLPLLFSLPVYFLLRRGGK